MLSLSGGGLPVSAPFPAVSGVGTCFVPQIVLESQPHRASPCWRRDKGAEGDMHRAGAEGTSGHRGALGGCSGEEKGPGTALHATLTNPSSQAALMPFSPQEVFFPLQRVKALWLVSQPGDLLALAPVLTLHSQAQQREWCCGTSKKEELV